jgi:hypothetical protein
MSKPRFFITLGAFGPGPKRRSILLKVQGLPRYSVSAGKDLALRKLSKSSFALRE